MFFDMEIIFKFLYEMSLFRNANNASTKKNSCYINRDFDLFEKK